MKKIYRFMVIAALLSAGSCSDDFLDETPVDFLSTPNAFKTFEDFNASLNNIYYLVRRDFYSRDEQRPMDYLYGTDIVFDGQPSTARHTNMIAAYHPTGSIAEVHWNLMYKIVSEANTILSRIQESDMTATQKLMMEAEARFFRALAYRTLAYLYGGVPLVVAEVTKPQTDFTRATKDAVLAQAIDDLLFAAENCPAITDAKEGEVNTMAAWHLLAEVYLAAGEYQNAVNAATEVIGNPAMALMQNRFGSRAGETPGDVYWDLFRKNNQNRSAGNTESIWVIQFETNVLGGGSETGSFAGSCMLERHHAPLIRDLRVDGKAPFRWPVGDYTGGRGIGWAISTLYFSDSIWQSDFDNDIRNANHNFVRDFVATNPTSPLYGTVVSTKNPPPGVTVPSRAFYAYQSKVTTPNNHPDELYANKATFELKNSAGATYTDQYMFRLAETYLIRAEAHLGMDQTIDAANDINEVRLRAEATPVAPEDVTIEYILDERMRELGVEEKRRLTLMRLGMLYERVVKCNPYYRDEMLPRYNLWPIPAAEIERNNEAVLEQNPDYD